MCVYEFVLKKKYIQEIHTLLALESRNPSAHAKFVLAPADKFTFQILILSHDLTSYDVV